MTPTAPSPAARPSLVYAWWVVLVLMVCYTLSFIDRQILSLLVRPPKSDLHVSDTQIGLLQGLAFAVFHTVWSIAIRRAVDTVTTWPAMHVPIIGLSAPWRFTFFVVGAPGVVVALLVSSLREPLRHGLKQNAGGQTVRLGAAEVVARSE